jgi:hypothetical protein
LAIAREIEAHDHAGAEQRRALAALGVELTERDRRLNGDGRNTVGLPPNRFSRILTGPTDQRLVGLDRVPPPWGERFRELCDAPA